MASNATLQMILNSVYREYAAPERIFGGPDWTTRELFEIDARRAGRHARAIELDDAPIAGGLTVLIGNLDRPVIDRTGLTGGFDFELEYVPEQALRAAAADVPSGPSIFTALQEQLGLKLEPTRESLDVLVIDSVEMPTPD